METDIAAQQADIAVSDRGYQKWIDKHYNNIQSIINEYDYRSFKSNWDDDNDDSDLYYIVLRRAIMEGIKTFSNMFEGVKE